MILLTILEKIKEMKLKFSQRSITVSLKMAIIKKQELN